MATQKTAGKNQTLVTKKTSVFDSDPNQKESGSCRVVKVDGNDVHLIVTLSENPPVSDSGKSYILANMNVVLDPKYKYNGKPIRISGNVMAKLPKGQK